MKPKLKWILLLPVICFCACSKHIPAVYEVVGMSLSNSNNTGQSAVDATIDSVPKQAYAIKMTLREEMRHQTDGDAQENGFTNEDHLTSMNISSLADFDNGHPAGTSLNSYFLTSLTSSATIDAFVAAGYLGQGEYKDGNYTDSWSSEQYLYLMSPPTLGSMQSFVVEIGFSDGRSMKDTVDVTLY